MKKTELRNYAKLIAKVGLNVKKGQDVIVMCELDQPEFVVMLVKEIYRLGARKVFVEWNMQEIDKLHYQYCTEKDLSTLESFQLEKWNYRAENLPCMCYLVSENPDGLCGVDQVKLANSKMAISKKVKPIRDKMEASYQWCICAVAGESWAKKVFPNDNKKVAQNKLWDAIFKASRAYGNPIENWKNHIETLKKRYTFLNEQRFVELRYKSSNGTNLRVGLNDLGLFTGGTEKTLKGVEFSANIPSEEIFTSPKAGDVDGIVYATKPLSFEGQLIENFYIKFENGKVTEVKAEKNQELLEKIVAMDEGASMLGECALVGFDSPINQTGVLFYETLFDENACCHLALGRGFSECLKGFENMTLEQRHANGLNDSIIHVDFMIGTSDLSIVGVTKDNKEIQIFKDGIWNI